MVTASKLADRVFEPILGHFSPSAIMRMVRHQTFSMESVLHLFLLSNWLPYNIADFTPLIHHLCQRYHLCILEIRECGYNLCYECVCQYRTFVSRSKPILQLLTILSSISTPSNKVAISESANGGIEKLEMNTIQDVKFSDQFAVEDYLALMKSDNECDHSTVKNEEKLSDRSESHPESNLSSCNHVQNALDQLASNEENTANIISDIAVPVLSESDLSETELSVVESDIPSCNHVEDAVLCYDGSVMVRSEETAATELSLQSKSESFSCKFVNVKLSDQFVIECEESETTELFVESASFSCDGTQINQSVDVSREKLANCIEEPGPVSYDQFSCDVFVESESFSCDGTQINQSVDVSREKLANCIEEPGPVSYDQFSCDVLGCGEISCDEPICNELSCDDFQSGSRFPKYIFGGYKRGSKSGRRRKRPRQDEKKSCDESVSDCDVTKICPKQQYETSEKGQSTRRRYNQSEKRKCSRNLYNQSQKRHQSSQKYWNSDKGRQTNSLRNRRYRNSPQFLKNWFIRKVALGITKKYAKQSGRTKVDNNFESCEVFIDFSLHQNGTDIGVLRNHVVNDEAFQREFSCCKKSLLKLRRKCHPPFVNSSRPAMYRLELSNVLERAIINYHLSEKSLLTTGMTKSNVLQKYQSMSNAAARTLANRIFLMRQACISQLTYCAHKLRDLAETILCHRDLMENKSDKDIALLGLQCHDKRSEPYFDSVSYTNGEPYDFSADITCNENCVLPGPEELSCFSDFVTKASLCPMEGPQAWMRQFVQQYTDCSKYQIYCDGIGKYLNPERMYLTPALKRNHPIECYNEQPICQSYEVLVRQLMVHYSNPRKFHLVMQQATRIHRLLADLDTASKVGDIRYLSKILQINVSKAPTVSKSSESEARNLHSDDIKKLLDEKPGLSKKSYIQLFEGARSNVPRNACISCRVLATPAESQTINVNRWKALKPSNLNSNHPYILLQQFCLQNGLLEQPRNNGTDPNLHPCQLLNGKIICSCCKISFSKGKVPQRSILNSMYTGECPDVIKALNSLELMICRRLKCFQTVIKPGPVSGKLPVSEKLEALKGRFILLPIHLEKTLEQLNSNKNSFMDISDWVYCYGIPTKQNKVWRQFVDRNKVFKALCWLKENNCNYSDVELPDSAESFLPHVFDDSSTENENSDHSSNCTTDNPDEMPNDSDDVISDVDSMLDSDNESDHGVDEESVFNGSVLSLSESDDSSDSENDFFDSAAMDGDNGSDDFSGSENDFVNSEATGCDESEESAKTDEPAFSGTAAPNNDKTDDQPKSFLEQVSKDDIENEYSHLVMVGVNADVQQANDFFKVLKIESELVPSHTENVDCLAFPEIFPYGKGGHDEKRPVVCKGAFYEKSHVLTSNNFARRQTQYLFYLGQQRELREIKQGIFQILNTGLSNITKAELYNKAKSDDVELMKRTTTLLGKLPSRAEFWWRVRQELREMTFVYGPPTFWVTMSPGDYDDSNLLAYLREMNSDIPDVMKLRPSQLICKDPVLACSYLQAKHQATYDLILSDRQPLGYVDHHFRATEYQGRLLPHFHCFFWIRDSVVIGVNSSEEVLAFINKYITCKLPSASEDKKLNHLVKRFNLHRCNSYCMRRRKACKPRCKFSFPREVRSKAILYDVATSIASRQSGSYKHRLYELERTPAEVRVNDYNPVLLQVWEGNIDVQFIAEDSETLADYITKYATKGPKSNFDEFDASKMVDKSNFSKLLSYAMRFMKEREMGCMEVRNYLLAEKAYITSEDFLYVNSRLPHKRKKTLKTKKILDDLPDESKDLFWGNLISSWYPNRPDDMLNMSLHDFAQTYRRASSYEVKSVKDKSRVLCLKNDAGYMMKRTLDKRFPSPIIVYGPFFDPTKNSEDFYYSKLLMHIPWRKEEELSGNPEDVYKKFRNKFPDLEASVQNAFKRLHRRQKMNKKVDEKMAGDKDKSGVPADFQEDVDTFEPVHQKSSIKTEEQLQEIVNSLSPDQRTVYDRVVENICHVAMHRKNPPTCDCNQLKPLNLFVSGNPGSGKSFLIKALMGYSYVESEVKNNPLHLVLCAPTGIAAKNINGKTLHSVWALPVQNNRQEAFSPLPDSVRCGMKANFYHTYGHLVDEISMVSNKLLLQLHLRMLEIFEDNMAFGGLPMIVFGDIFQLEPVRAQPPYVPLDPDQIAKISKGAPGSLNLWNCFEIVELTTNHRQDGDANSLWRGILGRMKLGIMTKDDIMHLNSRLVDTTGCSSKEDRLKIFVNDFIEADKKGLEPLCLFPLRSMCKDFNDTVLSVTGLKPILLTAIDEYHGSKQRKKEALRKVQNMDVDERDTAGLPKKIVLAVGCRVMYLVNEKGRPGIVNGARGTLESVIYERNKRTVKSLQIKFDDIDEVQTMVRVDKTFQVFTGCYVHRHQFPVVLSSAVTIHKSQSLSLNCVYADLGDAIFCGGQSYVAASRCTTLDGIRLFNFNPKNVYASKRANDYLVNLKKYGNSNMFNKNRRETHCSTERIWYTTKAEEKAKKATAGDINDEKCKKNQSGKKRKPAKKRHRPTTTRQAGPSSKKPAYESPSTSKTNNTQNDSDIEVTEGPPPVSLTAVFPYIPVNEAWQHMICAQFNLPFVVPSCVQLVHPINMALGRQPQRTHRVMGDGNCFYRAIAYIVTGDEQNWYFVKVRILEFIELNIDVLSGIIENHPNYVSPMYHVNGPSSQATAQSFFSSHSQPSYWADNIVISFTACMLKTRIILYTEHIWQPDYLSFDHLFALHSDHLVNPLGADLVETNDRFIYIFHNGVHFDPAGNG